MDVAAVAIGADLVEKTITEDRTTRSIEHVMSIEPPEMKRFVNLIHGLHIAFGSPRRIMSDQEKMARNAVRRSAFAVANAPAGTPLEALAIEFRRPGFGIGPELFEALSGMKLKNDVNAGHRLSLSDLVG
jgi:sialic acid synthase SpsE